MRKRKQSTCLAVLVWAAASQEGHCFPMSREGLHLAAGFAMMVGTKIRSGGRIPMINTRDAMQVLDHDFLEARGKILEIAAILDRIDRAGAAWRTSRLALEPVATVGGGTARARARPVRNRPAYFFARV